MPRKKKDKEVVNETTSQFEITAPFIFAGKTYLPGDEKNVPQDAQKAFTAKLDRIDEYIKLIKEMENE